MNKFDIIRWSNMGTLDPRLASRATRKGHKHLHNSSARPSVGKVSPAVYRQLQILHTRKRKRARKQLHLLKRNQRRQNG